MKQFKFSLIAIVAIVMGIAGSAFTHKPVPKAGEVAWYIYNGSGAMDDPASYHFDDGSEPACPSSIQELCAIQVEGDGETPGETELKSLYDNNNEFAAPVLDLIKFRSSGTR